MRQECARDYEDAASGGSDTCPADDTTVLPVPCLVHECVRRPTLPTGARNCEQFMRKTPQLAVGAQLSERHLDRLFRYPFASVGSVGRWTRERVRFYRPDRLGPPDGAFLQPCVATHGYFAAMRYAALSERASQCPPHRSHCLPLRPTRMAPPGTGVLTGSSISYEVVGDPELRWVDADLLGPDLGKAGPGPDSSRAAAGTPRDKRV